MLSGENELFFGSGFGGIVMKTYTDKQLSDCMSIYRKATKTEWLIGVVILVIVPVVMLWVVR